MAKNEPGAAVLAIFDQLINRIKRVHPVRSDDKPLGGGVLYSMLPLGMPVDPVDYSKPWVPQGNIDVTSAVRTGQLPARVAGGSSTPPTDPKADRALAAAYKTSVLCSKLLQVTTDGTYLPYPGGKHLDFAYESILTAMQPVPVDAKPDPKVAAAVDKANKILFEEDEDGVLQKSKKYKAYQKNASAYGRAKSDYGDAFAAAKSDPNRMSVWPVTSATYQRTVDEAREDLISGGAQAIENALDTLASLGNPIQAHMIAKAKAEFDAWNLALAGSVPSKIPYSFILPTAWADPTDDQAGWQTLSIDSSTYSHYDTSTALSQSQYSWFQASSSTGGGGGVSLGFISLGGSGGGSSSGGVSQGSGSSKSSQVIGSDASDLKISLEYALVDIQRPWLISDLFYMNGWYLTNGKKNSISTGKAADQVHNATQLLPLLPQQMLVIRRVRISTSKWGSLKTGLQTAYGTSLGSGSSSSLNVAGGAGVNLGFISFGGGVSHSSSISTGQASSFTSRDASSHFGTTFDGTTLLINGAQVVAYLCDIVPACPGQDDPQLAKTGPAIAIAAKPAR